MNQNEKRRVFSSLFYPVITVLVMWAVKLAEWEFGLNLGRFGLYPRTIEGLRGILLMPFIHGDFNHLINNSIPLIIMGSALFYFYNKVAFRVSVMILLAGGLWTWISARPSYHIGASGIVYGLFGFLLVSGFIRRSKSLVAISFLVAFIYGSLVWGILPIDYKISWEGHLWGLLAGVVLAYYYRKEGPQREVYEWEDEDDEKDEEDGEQPESSQPDRGNIVIQYHVRPPGDAGKE